MGRGCVGRVGPVSAGLHPALCTGDLTFHGPCCRLALVQRPRLSTGCPSCSTMPSRPSLRPAGELKGCCRPNPLTPPLRLSPTNSKCLTLGFLAPWFSSPISWLGSITVVAWFLALGPGGRQGNGTAQTVVSHTSGRGPIWAKAGKKQADPVKPRPQPIPSVPFSLALSSTPFSQDTFLESSPLPDLPQPTPDPHPALPWSRPLSPSHFIWEPARQLH